MLKKNITFCSIIFVASLQSFASITGTVTDGQKGLAGVPVSDGYTFVLTDDAGNYTIENNAKAHYIWPVTPSGYEPSSYTGCQTFFYKKISELTDGRADFVLNPIGDDSSFSFLTIADPQPKSDENTFAEIRKAYLEMKGYAAKMAQEDGFTPLALFAGDITANIGYERYHQICLEVEPNYIMLNVPGNHDRLYVTDYDESTQTYQDEFGPTWYSFNRGGIHFLMLDNLHVDTDGEYAYGQIDAAKQWLKNDMALVPEGTAVVLVGHACMTKSNKLRKAYADVFEALAGHETLILTGHAHSAFNLDDMVPDNPNITEKNLGTLSGAHYNGPLNKDGTPNCYYIFKAKDGKIVDWKFIPFGKDPDKWQLRLYKPCEFTEEQDFVKAEDTKTIYANVYDWDAHFNVVWDLDGEKIVAEGPITSSEKIIDPWAWFCYSHRGIDWLASCLHLFKIEVPNTVGEVAITITDRFGHTYSQTQSLPHIEGSVDTVTCGEAVETTEYFDILGRNIDTPLGICIARHRLADGSIITNKVSKINF